MIITETEQSAAKIEFYGRGRSNADIAKAVLDEWRPGGAKYPTIRDMFAAEEYFLCRNSDIALKTRDYTDADGFRQVNRSLSNARIPSGFLRANVRQKVNYAFGKPFVFSVESPPDGDEDSAAAYSGEWRAFISAGFYRTLARIATDAVNKGIGWAYVTIIDGRLSLQDIDPCQLYPVWYDKAHTRLDAVIRDYILTEYINSARRDVKKVEYWDAFTAEIYTERNRLVPDGAVSGGHMSFDGRPVSWGRVPFVALKGTEDELPVLNVIRAQIDAYDALQSKAVDALLDDIDPVLLLRGVSPAMDELSRARLMIQNSRIVSVDEDGDARYLKNEPSIEAASRMLEILKKDIREFGQSVDTQDIRFGSNPSGVALKSMYQDLDIYVNGLENEFRSFISNLKYFFDIWLEYRGIGTARQWEKYTLNVTLNRDLMINSTADIQETVMLASTGVSQQTLDEWNPAVISHDIEKARRESERAVN